MTEEDKLKIEDCPFEIDQTVVCKSMNPDYANKCAIGKKYKIKHISSSGFLAFENKTNHFHFIHFKRYLEIKI